LPDAGYNGYISVGADGRVVTPQNLTPQGVIAAGDLATHADLDTLVDTYDLADVAHLADIPAPPDLSPYIVGDSAREIAGPFSLRLQQAATFDTFFSADYDFGAGGIRSWADYAYFGYFTGSGAITLSTVDNMFGTVTRFWFCSLSNTLQNVDGVYFFYVIGTP
jgi:hypothetical protein